MARRTTPRASEALDRYLTVRSARLARVTIVNDRSALTKFVQGVGDPYLHELTAAAVEDYFADHLAHQSPASWNQARSRIKTYVEFCHRRGWMSEDVLAEVHPRKVARRHRRSLSAAQLHQLLDACTDPRDRAVVAVGMCTALRAATLTTLTVGDVDLEQGVLHAFISKSQYEDDLPLSSEADAELRRWLTHYAVEVGRPLRPQDLLLPARGNPSTRLVDGKPVTCPGRLRPDRPITQVSKVVKRPLEALGLDEKGAGAHTLRRSAARQLFEQASEAGHDGALRITASLLGHSSVTVTERYIQVAPDRLKRDALIKGRPMFPVDDSNVVQLRRAE